MGIPGATRGMNMLRRHFPVHRRWVPGECRDRLKGTPEVHNSFGCIGWKLALKRCCPLGFESTTLLPWTCGLGKRRRANLP